MDTEEQERAASDAIFDKAWEERADILKLQNKEELRWLWHRFRDPLTEAPAFRTPWHPAYLEIGSRRGGSFWIMTQAMPKGSLSVCLDMPNARWGDPESFSHLLANINALNALDYNVQPIFADSHKVSTALHVERSLGAYHGFDLIMVDGDHTQEGAELDFEMYRRYVRPGGMMAFHDIYVSDFGVMDAFHGPIVQWAHRRGWRVETTPDMGSPSLGFGVIRRPK